MMRKNKNNTSDLSKIEALNKEEAKASIENLKKSSPKPSYRFIPKGNTIILLHGFNSGPGQKAQVIHEYLIQNHLTNDYDLIAPKLDCEPKKAVSQIKRLIRN